MKPFFGVPRLAVVSLMMMGAAVLPSHAQELREYKQVGTLSAATLNRNTPQVFGPGIAKATQELRLYRVVYTSRDQENKNTRLSGLVAIPAKGAPRGLVLWNHGTITQQASAPSNYRPGGKAETGNVLLAFGSGGYAVAMPDYLGYGENSQGVHPYPMGKINARSALDLMNPSRVLGKKLKRPIGRQVWVAGYSQGGAVAMWTARLLQERGTPPVRSAALSGPYDLTGATRESLLTTPQNDVQFYGQIFLASLMARGYVQQRHLNYSELFKPAMALAVRSAYAAEKPDEDRIKGMALAAKIARAKSLRDVLSPKFATALEAVDTRHPLIQEMRESDCLDWTPRAPLLLWALQGDTIVPVGNTDNAMAAFAARRVGRDRVRAVIVNDSRLDHAKAGIPAVKATRLFFDGGFAAVPEAK